VDVPIEGWIVLGVTITAILVIAVVMIVRSFRYHWPEGYVRTDATFRGCKVSLLTPKNFDSLQRKALARRCAFVVRAMKETWQWPDGVKRNQGEFDDLLDWTVCWFKTQEDFDRLIATWPAKYRQKTIAAHTGTIAKKGFGGGLPASISTVHYAAEVFSQGTPFRHELTHHLIMEVLGMWDRDHQMDSMWRDYPLRFNARYRQMVDNDA
jgi:hypothetical protein